jgi:hypothetical protein
MFSWFREGSIHKIPFSYRLGLDYINLSPDISIKKINIWQINSQQKIISLHPSAFKADEIYSRCAEFFPDRVFEKRYYYQIEFPFDSLESLEQIIKFLKSLNVKFNRQEFPQELLTDIRKDFLSTESFNANPQPLLPSYNPKFNILMKSEGSKLVTLFDRYQREYFWSRDTSFPIKELESLLTSGENPNQILGDSEENIIHKVSKLRAMDKKQKELLVLLLLSYGANPLLRNRDNYYSALEEAIDLKDYFFLNLIQNFLTTPEKPVGFENTAPSLMRFPMSSDQKKLAEVISFEVKSVDKRMFTHLELKDNPIDFEFCGTHLLTPAEMKNVYVKYLEYFEGSKTLQGTLEDFFKYEVEGPLKYIELIKSKGVLVGVNLYEVVMLKDDPNTIFLHISCLFIDEKFRGLGLTNPLAISPNFELKKLYPDKNIVCVYQSISYGSASIVKNISYYPKFQPDFFKKIAPKIVDHIQRNAKFIELPGGGYSEIEVQNRMIAGKAVQGLTYKDFLFNRQRDLIIVGEERHRGVLIMFEVNDESRNEFYKLMTQMKLNPDAYVAERAKYLANIVNGVGVNLADDKSVSASANSAAVGTKKF